MTLANVAARLALTPVRSTHDEARAQRSPFLWGTRPGQPGRYVLTPLGLLNSALGWLRLPPLKVRDPFAPAPRLHVDGSHCHHCPED